MKGYVILHRDKDGCLVFDDGFRTAEEAHASAIASSTDLVAIVKVIDLKPAEKGIDINRVYTHVTAHKVPLDAPGWCADSIEDLKKQMKKPKDTIFRIKVGLQKPFMLFKDTKYRALFYAARE